MSELRRGGAELMRLLVGTVPGVPPTGELIGYTEKIGGETRFYTISPEGFVRTFASPIPPVTFTAGEDLVAGELGALINDVGVTRLVKADADGTSTRQTAAGIVTVGALTGASAEIATTGPAAIPDAEWDVVPVAADIGSPVFMSLTPGNVTLTSPGSGTIQRVGIVAVVGGGSTTVLVQVGQPVR